MTEVALRRLARTLRPFAVAIAVALLIAALLSAIYFTGLSWEWITFLAGILTAAVLSLVSRAARMEWRMARRSAQLAQCRERLALEQAARQQAERELAAVRGRLERLEHLVAEDTAAAAVPPHAEHGLYADTMAEELTGWKDAGARLLAALENDEFVLYCQPIVPVADRSRQTLHEVLIRLCEEEEKLLPPGAFLPIAERFGLMPEIDRWVTGHLLAWVQRRAAAQAGWQPALFSINLAGATLADDGFPAFVQQEAQRRGVAPEVLCFEIYEADMLHDRARAARTIGALRGFGCRIALAGFGRHRVSLDLLKAVPLDFVKIDGSVVLNFLRDAVALAKLKAIARVCRALGILTIAELVESEDIWKGLQTLDVDYAQGFGIGTPRPLDGICD